MSYDVDAQVFAAASWVGFTETPPGSNVQPFTAWQFSNVVRNLSWCASFFNFCADQEGGFRWPLYCTFNWKGDAYCPYIVDHSRIMGIWHGPGELARKGWGAVFSWGRNGVADHIEMVEHDTGSTFVTIGGNTDDGVRRKLRDRAFLMGFVALDAAGQTSATPTPPPKEIEMGYQLFTDELHAGLDAGHPKQAVLQDDGTIILFNGCDVGKKMSTYGKLVVVVSEKPASWKFMGGSGLRDVDPHSPTFGKRVGFRYAALDTNGQPHPYVYMFR